MNDEIRNNEIREEDLEQVSGGAERQHLGRDGVCSICGCSARNCVIDGKTYLVCVWCGHREE